LIVNAKSILPKRARIPSSQQSEVSAEVGEARKLSAHGLSSIGLLFLRQPSVVVCNNLSHDSRSPAMSDLRCGSLKAVVRLRARLRVPAAGTGDRQRI